MNRTVAILPTFEPGEWQSRIIEGESLTPADQHLKQSLEAGDEGRLLVDELRSGVRITARSWVGVVRFEYFEVRVVPKLAGDDLGLVEMIEYATGLDALRRASSARTLHAEGAGLVDLLALLLAEAAEVILRGGILADYVEREDELLVLRGRLLGDQQVMRRFGQIDRLVCRFDEHEQDIVENQLLAAALGRCSTRVTHESVRRRVRRLLAIFQEVCRAHELDLDALRHNGIVYHRLNDHYRDAHALAWLLLDGLGTRDLLASGKTRCFAFLIDMNRLFEMFVFRLIDQLLTGTGLHLHYQRGDRSIIVNASTNQPYARVVPDLLIEATDPTIGARVAVDAKYKLYDLRKLDSGDVYQSFLYAYAFSGARVEAVPAALLLYPSSTRSSQSVRLRVRSAQATADAEIVALGFSIPAALAEVTHGVRGPVAQAIVEAIQQGIGRSRTVAA
jgi:5-methylcytosine-specific restriction enzyme subunit McrC